MEWTGPPSWVSDLPHLSLSIVEDGRALELRNTGGAMLPANTSLTVDAAGSPRETSADLDASSADAVGSVTTGAALEPGESVYVTGDANASSFTLRDESARGEYAFDTAKLHGKRENTTYTLVTERDE